MHNNVRMVPVVFYLLHCYYIIIVLHFFPIFVVKNCIPFHLKNINVISYLLYADKKNYTGCIKKLMRLYFA